uniref:Uncharacterized protein n=1 Tax=viral metagenome TaxID=1070528 RepID=A0A6C0EFN4_9ZZZZ
MPTLEELNAKLEPYLSDRSYGYILLDIFLVIGKIDIKPNNCYDGVKKYALYKPDDMKKVIAIFNMNNLFEVSEARGTNNNLLTIFAGKQLNQAYEYSKISGYYLTPEVPYFLYRGLIKEDGVHKTFNNDGNLCEEYTIKNGVLDGNRKKWVMNMEHDDINYENGMLHGYYKSSHYNGFPHVITTYFKGLLDGHYEEYTREGIKITDCTYNKGVLEGKKYEWYETGVKKTESSYTNGLLKGSYASWYNNGFIELECNYEGGKLNGMYTKFTSYGTKDFQTLYKNNVEDGYCFTFTMGKLLKYRIYEDGKCVKESYDLLDVYKNWNVVQNYFN